MGRGLARDWTMGQVGGSKLGRRSSNWLAGLGLALAVLVGSSLSAQPLVSLGQEFQVNTTTTDFQIAPDVAMAADGSFVVVWESRDQDGSGDGIFAQRFDATGDALGGELQVNTYTTGDQSQPAISRTADGGFLVVWASAGGGGIGEGGGPEDGSGLGIQLRRFDASGTAVGDELQINAGTAGNQEWPAITRRSDDGFVVAWESADADGSLDAIRARRLDASGALLGAELAINGYTTGDQRRPTVAPLADGAFVVSWESEGSPADSEGTGVIARRFAADGSPTSGDVQVNATTSGDQGRPGVSSSADGRFLVVWQQDTGGDLDVYARRFDATGAAVAGELRVDPGLAGSQSRPAAALDFGANTMVVWESTTSTGSDDSQTSVQARLVGPGGALVDDAFQVNTYTPNDQYAAVVAGSGAGDFVVVWSNFEVIGEVIGEFDGQVEESGALGPPPTDDNRGIQAQRLALVAAEVQLPLETFGVGGETVDLTVDLEPSIYSLSSVAFSLDYDEACLDFDPTDSDMDGIPDAVTVAAPAGFDVTVLFDPGDTDGELDVLIADVPPDLVLPSGELLTVGFDVVCSAVRGGSTTAGVEFSTDPAPSFGDTGGLSVAGAGRGGVVTILPGPRGDCNGDAAVDAADVGALGLELFDADGSVWLDVPGGSFVGSPAGCDANADTTVDAGDVSCTTRRIFASPCDGDLPPGRPSLTVPRFLPVSGGVATASFDFAADGVGITSLVASLDVDPARLDFDPTDGDLDGVPDSVRIVGASPATIDVSWDPADADGELDLLLADTVMSPTAFADGVLIEIDFTPLVAGPTVADGLAFASDPAASFGDAEGLGVPGDAQVVEPILFADGFESGNLDAWTSFVP